MILPRHYFEVMITPSSLFILFGQRTSSITCLIIWSTNGFGGKALRDLQVYSTFSADAVPCCRRSIRLRWMCQYALSLVATDQPMCPMWTLPHPQWMSYMSSVLIVSLRLNKGGPCGLS